MLSNTEIGARIRVAREDRKLTQQNIADVLGMNKSTIQRYEAGTIDKIKQPVIEAIAKLLDVNLQWLIGQADKREIKSKSAESKTEQRLKLLARHLDEIPEEKRNKIISNFEDTIDDYLEIMGINKGDK